MRDPKGKPGCFRESVDNAPIRPRWSSVRARSAKDGSGTTGASLVVPACFLLDEEDIAAPSTV